VDHIEYLRRLGRKGGKVRSTAKQLSNRDNVRERWRRRHVAEAGGDPCEDCTLPAPCGRKGVCEAMQIVKARERP
jgi:hypothetical protein